jgi:hypothetical protein
MSAARPKTTLEARCPILGKRSPGADLNARDTLLMHGVTYPCHSLQLRLTIRTFDCLSDRSSAMDSRCTMCRLGRVRSSSKKLMCRCERSTVVAFGSM